MHDKEILIFMVVYLGIAAAVSFVAYNAVGIFLTVTVFKWLKKYAEKKEARKRT